MSLRLPRLTLLLALAFAPLFGAAPPFPHEQSDLKPDPAAKFGKLENGVRYVIYPNAEPKGRVSMRLLVLAGSLHEEENQRGVAHFLEHMAFNGSKHFAPGTLVEFFQRMGMSFGGDTNASTGFDRTLYVLELPDTKTETLEEGLRVLADDANGLLLKNEEIDKERGIIMSEKRVRDSIAFRTQIAQFNFMLGDTRLPARIPIGQAEVIEKAPRERFVEFWDTWYRPEKIAVIAVGEVDVPAMEKLIAAAFSSVTARGPAKPVPSLGAVTKFEGVRAGFHREAEAPATSVGFACMTPITVEPDNAANRLKRLPRQLAVAMLNRRLSVLAKKENAPFSAARASVSENFDLFREASVDLTCKPEQWMAALAVGEQELRRALEHGFQPAELKEAAANMANSLDQAVKTAKSRRSSALSDQIANTILNDNVFTDPATNQALFKPALDKVTPADCTAALRAAFAGNGRYVMVTGNATIPGDAVAAITAAYDASRAVAVAPPPKEESGAWAYTNFGAPGQVAKREHIVDLDVTLVTFANGVRLNLKKTDFEAGRIRLGARVGNGAITEPRDQRGLAQLAGGTFNAGGLGKLSVDDLRRVLAGRNAPVGFGLATDAFTFSSGQGSTNRDDLLLTLQLLTAHLTDPGYRPEALRQAQKGIEQMYLGFAHTPNGPMSTEVANLIASGDSRFGLPPKEVMLARNLDEVRAWLAPQFAKGAIELAVVGDLDVDATIAAVAQTLGALPPREAKSELKELRQVSFPAQPFTKSYTISSELPKGLVTLYWPTTDASEIKRTRRLAMLASVYSDRLRVKIREEMAGTYSPRAGSNASDTFAGYGYITTSIDVDPPMADKVAEAAIALADDMAKNGVTDEELNRARQPALTAAKESQRTNGYWLGSVLAKAQEKPEVLDWSRTRLPDLEAITAAELSALAKQYLGRARVSRVTVLPEKPAAKSAAAPAASTALALSSPAADQAWQAYQDLAKRQPSKAPAEMSRREIVEFSEQLAQDKRAAALAFLEKYPTDPRRWSIVAGLTPLSPRFIKEFGPDNEKGLPTPVIDEPAAAAWKAKVAELKASMAAATDLPLDVQESQAWGEFAKDFRATTAAKNAGQPYDYSGFRPRFAAHVAKYGSLPNMPARAGDYLGALEKMMPGTSAAEWQLLQAGAHAGLAKQAGEQLGKLAKQADLKVKPLEMAFTAVDGRKVDLKELRGKVVLIDFWATWCGPCIAELPNIKRVYAAYHDKGFEIVGIALENGRLLPADTAAQTAEKMKKAAQVLTDFTTKENMPWPQYFDGKYWKNDISTQYDINSIPAMFLVDQEGKVVSTNARGEALEKEVKRLLKL